AEARILVRLACVRHAASVRSEPGSNSPVKLNNLSSIHRPAKDRCTGILLYLCLEHHPRVVSRQGPSRRSAIQLSESDAPRRLTGEAGRTFVQPPRGVNAFCSSS